MPKEFKCRERCAACCGPVPIPKGMWTCYKHLAKPAEYFMETDFENWVIQSNMDCVFLDDYKCLIYEHRPDICREYGHSEQLPCPYIKPNGNKRSPAQTRRIERQKAKEFKEVMKRFEEKGKHG